MKQLIAGSVILLVLGIGGFFYRNALERPVPAADNPNAIACTADAKLCPDGSAVGRTSPDCRFAACPFPNAEDAALGLAFLVPPGYEADPSATGADEALRAAFTKPAKGSAPHTIIIRRFAIDDGKTADETILAHTQYEPSGNMAESMTEFTPVIANGRTYQSVVLERFEGQVHSAYYLVRDADVLRFEIVEQDVDWTNPDLKVERLPEHQALLALLASVQSD